MVNPWLIMAWTNTKCWSHLHENERKLPTNTVSYLWAITSSGLSQEMQWKCWISCLLNPAAAAATAAASSGILPSFTADCRVAIFFAIILSCLSSSSQYGPNSRRSSFPPISLFNWSKADFHSPYKKFTGKWENSPAQEIHFIRPQHLNNTNRMNLCDSGAIHRKDEMWLNQ